MNSILVVTGISGSGKTTALKALEDQGFFCIDNMPSVLIEKVLELNSGAREIKRVAFGIDIREGPYLQDLPSIIQGIKDLDNKAQVLFLDAEDRFLIRRYSETRRKHPLAADGNLGEAFRAERQLLTPVRNIADKVIDTTGLSPHQLKDRINAYVMGNTQPDSMSVTVMSFGFRHGLPAEADLVFDVRFLPNPHFIPELRPLTGFDKEVSEYVLAFTETKEFLSKISDMLDFLLPRYIKEGKSYLTVSIGCTGGQHRSVAIANEVVNILSELNHEVRIKHRDIQRNQKF